jgi:hypothetical protein
MTNRITQIAAHLLGDGIVDNEADANLAALRILLARTALDHEPKDDDVGE